MSFPSSFFGRCGATVVCEQQDGPRSWTVWTHECIGRDADCRRVIVEKQYNVRVSRRGTVKITCISEQDRVCR